MTEQHRSHQPAMCRTHRTQAASRDKPLREVIGGGLRAVDIARISGVSQSTLSRLWSEARWLEHVGGSTLARLIAVSPEVDRYVRRSGEQERLRTVVHSLNSVGAELRHSTFMPLLESATASAVITALSAAAEMMNGHYTDASRMFAIGWNENSNKVIDALFATDTGGIFENCGEFLARADRYIHSAPSFCDLAEVVGYGIVKHKMIRTGYATPLSRSGRNHGDAIAFLERSQVIGQIFKDDDLALVDSYRDKVANQQSLAINEVWSHATYANDISMEQQKNTAPIQTSGNGAHDHS